MQEQPEQIPPTSAVKRIRKLLGMSQNQFAQMMGMTQGNVGHYENTGQVMPPEVAKKLIYEASVRGQRVTFEDIYGEPERAQG